ncbi:MAG: RNA polymerase sigma factor [Pseudomonadota bacterium]
MVKKQVEQTNQERNAPSSQPTDQGQPSLRHIYEHHSHELVGYLRRRFGDGPPDPEDMAQQAFEKLLRRDSVQDIKNLRAFLWSTARNLTISSLRRDKTHAAYDFEVECLYFAEPGVEKGPERVVEVEQQLSIISEVLSAMPEPLRETFVMHKVDGIGRPEIARRLNMSRSAIAKRLAKAAAIIDEALEDHRKRR